MAKTIDNSQQGLIRQARKAALAKTPLAKMLERVKTRCVAGCNHRCCECKHFIGHTGSCPGVWMQPPPFPRRTPVTPICHVHFRTGRMELPFDDAGRFVAGQEKFWKHEHVAGPFRNTG